MGSSTPNESKSDSGSKSDNPGDANTDANTDANSDGDGDDDDATPEADAPKDDAEATPEATPPAESDPADDVIRKLAASIDKGDTDALKGLLAGRSGLTVDGEALTLDQIDRALMARLSAPAQGGPAPRVAFRCDPPKRKGMRTCTVFQSKGSWTVKLRSGDAGSLHIHALTFAAN